MTWTHAICDECWSGNYPDRKPHKLLEPEQEVCCACGFYTRSGIYVRRDPRSVQFPSARKAREWPHQKKVPARGPSFDSDLEKLVKMGFLDEEARPQLERAYDAGISDLVNHVVRVLVAR